MAPRPSDAMQLGGMPSRIAFRQESGVGLIEVVEIGPYGRTLMIDGVTQEA